ncbi:hypothetical protein LUZ63_013008 [Rhynchospora breviuscula]|uniref:mannan endo-1,4-beta-mannosidase n=1 Tax=Rhynchospora breviuscula TaxID=2022672 RepID=A0A9Q0C7Q2_9POAL|nr:hypothetical protein LUZ63_013008 [Rhynchospora breviuscula]
MGQRNLSNLVLSSHLPFQSLFLATSLLSIFLSHLPFNFSINSSHAGHRMEGSTGISEAWPMVERNGTQLLTKDEPFVIHGFNTYWLMVFAVDPETRHKISDVFSEAKEAGLNTCRTWAFNDGGWRALQVSPFNYDEEVLQALDFVLSEARKHRIRLILSLCNNWNDYGGRSQYIKWGQESGLDLTSDDDFFSDTTLKSYYKGFVEAVLTRTNMITNIEYKNDATILAWEIINEPRCPSDPSGDTLQAWIEEMSAFVKSIDPVHLVQVGLEGFYGPSTPELMKLNPDDYSGVVGTDFIRNHQAPSIDLASVHIYPDVWLSHSDQDDHIKFVQNWMDQHMSDSKDPLNMPIVFAEFGISIRDERFGTGFRELFMDTVYGKFLRSLETGGPGGGCILWQLFPEGAEHMDDGYAVVLAKYPSTFSLVSLQSKRLSDGAST